MNPTTNKDQLREQAERAQEAASSALEKAKETGASVAEKAKETAAQAGQTARNIGANIGQRAENATEAVASGMQSMGERIRHTGPDSGFLGTAKEKVAGALEQSGRYLHEKHLSGLGEDLTNLIRRNPIPALLAGIGLGFLLARTMRR